jgi:hypothetical protein
MLRLSLFTRAGAVLLCSALICQELPAASFSPVIRRRAVSWRAEALSSYLISSSRIPTTLQRDPSHALVFHSIAGFLRQAGLIGMAAGVASGQSSQEARAEAIADRIFASILVFMVGGFSMYGGRKLRYYLETRHFPEWEGSFDQMAREAVPTEQHDLIDRYVNRIWTHDFLENRTARARAVEDLPHGIQEYLGYFAWLRDLYVIDALASTPIVRHLAYFMKASPAWIARGLMPHIRGRTLLKREEDGQPTAPQGIRLLPLLTALHQAFPERVTTIRWTEKEVQVFIDHSKGPCISIVLASHRKYWLSLPFVILRPHSKVDAFFYEPPYPKKFGTAVLFGLENERAETAQPSFVQTPEGVRLARDAAVTKDQLAGFIGSFLRLHDPDLVFRVTLLREDSPVDILFRHLDPAADELALRFLSRHLSLLGPEAPLSVTQLTAYIWNSQRREFSVSLEASATVSNSARWPSTPLGGASWFVNRGWKKYGAWSEPFIAVTLAAFSSFIWYPLGESTIFAFSIFIEWALHGIRAYQTRSLRVFREVDVLVFSLLAGVVGAVLEREGVSAALLMGIFVSFFQLAWDQLVLLLDAGSPAASEKPVDIVREEPPAPVAQAAAPKPVNLWPQTREEFIRRADDSPTLSALKKDEPAFNLLLERSERWVDLLGENFSSDIYARWLLRFWEMALSPDWQETTLQTPGRIKAFQTYVRAPDSIYQLRMASFTKLTRHTAFKLLPVIVEEAEAAESLKKLPLEKKLRLPIDSFDWSERTRNGLHNAGIIFLGDLYAKTAADLLLTKNLGKVSAAEVSLFFKNLGILWGPQPIEELRRAFSSPMDISIHLISWRFEKIYYALRKAGVETVRDIYEKQAEFENHRYLGDDGRKEINKLLKRLGLPRIRFSGVTTRRTDQKSA